MYLGGLLLTLLSCDVKVTQDPFSIDIESSAVCRYNPKGQKLALKSSVEISFMVDGQKVGGGSGNYFKHKGNKFVLTAAHVAKVGNELDLIVEEAIGVGFTKAEVVYINEASDIAVIKLEEELSTVKPVKWKRKDYWEVNTGEELYYTGNPMGIQRLSIRGNVAKIHYDMIIMQGFAYDGASGSAVFDRRGNVIGVVSAIPMDLMFGQFPQKIDSLVMIGILSSLHDDELHYLLEGTDG